MRLNLFLQNCRVEKASYKIRVETSDVKNKSIKTRGYVRGIGRKKRSDIKRKRQKKKRKIRYR